MSTTSSVGLEVPVVYVRWEAQTPARDKAIDSPAFRFQNSEWYLHIYNSFGSNAYYLYAYNKGQECSSFVVSVHVEDVETRRILPQLSQKTSCTPSSSLIWSKSVADVQRMTRIHRNYSKLKFLVVLKKEDVLTDIDSRETQTDCYPPEAAGHTCSTTSTAVQTSVLHNLVPCLESLSEDFHQLMVRGSDPDVKFLCGGQSTGAHRSVVCSRSPVIASMLASDMVEGRTGVVTIPDMEPDIFRQFLCYLYSGQLGELTFATALRLYEAGDQYSVRGLARRCREFLMEHLSVDNACEVLAVADAHGDSTVVEKVIEYILENKIPLVSDRWSAFCADHPELSIKVLTHYYKTSLNIGGNSSLENIST